MAITSADKVLIFNDTINYYESVGLYVSEAQDRVRWYDLPGQTISVPISSSPVGTSGSMSPLDVIVKGLVESITTYYSTSAIGVSGFGLTTENGVSAIGSRLGINFNVSNLRINNSQLDTIQNLSQTSIPTFRTISATNLTNGLIVIVSAGMLITSAISHTSDHGNLTGLLDDDHSQYLQLQPTSSERNILSAASDINLQTFRVISGQTRNPLLLQDVNQNVIFYLNPAGNLAITSSVSSIGTDLILHPASGYNVVIETGNLAISGNTFIKNGLNVSGTAFIGSLNGIVSASDGRISAISVLPISVGGTNNNSYSGAQFLWYNGSQLTSSPFSSGSFLTSADGTLNYHAKFIATNQVGDSIISDDGVTVSVHGSLQSDSLVGVGTRYVTVDASGLFSSTSAIGSISGTGSGTIDKIPKFITSATIGDSIMRESGATIVYEGSISANGSLKITGDSTFNSLSGTGTRLTSVNAFGQLGINGSLAGDYTFEDDIAFFNTTAQQVLFTNGGNYVSSHSNLGFNGSLLEVKTPLNVSGIASFGTTVKVFNGGIELDNGQNVSWKNSNGTLRFGIGLQTDNSFDIGGTVDGGIRFYTGLGNLRGNITSAGNWVAAGNLNVSGTTTLHPFIGTTTRYVGVNSSGQLTVVGNVSADVNGTVNRIPKFNTTLSLNDSIMRQETTTHIVVEGQISATSNITAGIGVPVYLTKRFTVIGNSFDNTTVQFENTDVNTVANGRAFNFGITDVTSASGRFDLTQPGERTIFSVHNTGDTTFGTLIDSGFNFEVSGTSRFDSDVFALKGLNVSGLATFNSGIDIKGRLLNIDPGQIAYAAGTNGIVIRGNTGGTNDLTLVATDGTIVMNVPAGTTRVVFPTSVFATSTLNVSGITNHSDNINLYNTSTKSLRLYRSSNYFDIDNNGQLTYVGDGSTNLGAEWNYSNIGSGSTLRWRFAGIDVLGFTSTSLNISATTIFNSFIGTGTRYVGVNSLGQLTIVGNVSADINGTANRIPKFNTTLSLNDSIMRQESTTHIVVEGSLSASGNITSNDTLILTKTDNVVRTNSNLKRLLLNGGSTDDALGGAFMYLYGNSYPGANAGRLLLGTVSTSDLSFYTNNSLRSYITSAGSHIYLNPIISSSVLNVSGAITAGDGLIITGGNTSISMVDNSSEGFVLKQGSNEYIEVRTTNSSESITLGNATTNPTVQILNNSFLAGALNVSGVASIHDAIQFTNLGSGGIGRIWRGASHGLNLQAVGGTTNDFALNSALGDIVMRIPTGVSTVDFPGNLGIGTTSPGASLQISKQMAALSGTANPYGLYLYPTSSGEVFIDAVTNLTSNTSMRFRVYTNGTYYDAIKINNVGGIVMSSTLNVSGSTSIKTLAGSTTRLVTADSNGLLSTMLINSVVSGVGTNGVIPKFTGANSIANSIMTESSGVIVLVGQLSATTVETASHLYVNGVGNFYGTLNVSQEALFSDNITVQGHTLLNTLNVSGLASLKNVNINGTLLVTSGSVSAISVQSNAIVKVYKNLRVGDAIEKVNSTAFPDQDVSNLLTIVGSNGFRAPSPIDFAMGIWCQPEIPSYFSNGVGLYTQVRTSGTFGNSYGVYAGRNTITSGTLNNTYGVYVESQNAASIGNYSIYTNSGQVRLGGAIVAISDLNLSGTARIRSNLLLSQASKINAVSYSAEGETTLLELNTANNLFLKNSTSLGNIHISATQNIYLNSSTITKSVNVSGGIQIGLVGTEYPLDVYQSWNGTNEARIAQGSSTKNWNYFKRDVSIGDHDVDFATLYLAKSNATLDVHQADNSSTGPRLSFRKSRGTFPSSLTDAQNGDNVFELYGAPRSDGINYACGGIYSKVDGTFTTGQRPPTSLHFYTNVANTSIVERLTIKGNSNIGFNTTSQFGSGVGVLGLANASTAPTTTPTNAVVIYSEGGAAKVLGGSGTITTFGPAHPHCPECGADFMTEHENKKYGYLAVCLNCLAKEMGDRPWILRKKVK